MSTSSSCGRGVVRDLEHHVEADALGDAALGAEGADLDQRGCSRAPRCGRAADRHGSPPPAHAAARRRSRSRPWHPRPWLPVIAPPAAASRAGRRTGVNPRLNSDARSARRLTRGKRGRRAFRRRLLARVRGRRGGGREMRQAMSSPSRRWLRCWPARPAPAGRRAVPHAAARSRSRWSGPTSAVQRGGADLLEPGPPPARPGGAAARPGAVARRGRACAQHGAAPDPQPRAAGARAARTLAAHAPPVAGVPHRRPRTSRWTRSTGCSAGRSR